MGSTLGDQTICIKTGSLKVGNALVDAIRILLRAAALEDILHSRGIPNLLRRILTTGEQTPVAEHLRTTQGDEFGGHTTH